MRDMVVGYLASQFSQRNCPICTERNIKRKGLQYVKSKRQNKAERFDG